MLSNHIRQHPFSLPAIVLITDSATTPGNFLPDQNAQFITEIQNDFRLLIMSQTNEIHSHLLHHLHFLYHLLLSHGSGHACMIFMPVRTSQQQTSSIQHERAFFDEFKRTETETFTCCHFLSVGRYSNFASI